MWKTILLAWIAGISVMGKTFNLPFLLPGLMIFSVGSGLLYWYQYSKLESHHPIPWLSRAVFILALGILTGTLGYRYADHALEQRLDNRKQKQEILRQLFISDILMSVLRSRSGKSGST